MTGLEGAHRTGQPTDQLGHASTGLDGRRGERRARRRAGRTGERPRLAARRARRAARARSPSPPRAVRARASRRSSWSSSSVTSASAAVLCSRVLTAVSCARSQCVGLAVLAAGAGSRELGLEGRDQLLACLPLEVGGLVARPGRLLVGAADVTRAMGGGGVVDAAADRARAADREPAGQLRGHAGDAPLPEVEVGLTEVLGHLGRGLDRRPRVAQASGQLLDLPGRCEREPRGLQGRAVLDAPCCEGTRPAQRRDQRLPVRRGREPRPLTVLHHERPGSWPPQPGPRPRARSRSSSCSRGSQDRATAACLCGAARRSDPARRPRPAPLDPAAR